MAKNTEIDLSLCSDGCDDTGPSSLKSQDYPEGGLAERELDEVRKMVQATEKKRQNEFAESRLEKASESFS